MRWTAGRRGVVLPVALLGALLVTAGASLPVDSCPRHLDCTLQRRQSCKPGSTQCGPCIEPLIENEYGNCVQKQQQHTTGGNLANVDEEIDYLASVVTKQGLQKQHLSQEALQPPLTEDKPNALDSNEVQNRLAAQIQLEQSNASLTTVAGTTVKKVTEKSGPVASHYPATDAIIFAMIIVCTVVGSTALIVAAVCWLRLQKEVRLAQKVDYPAFGVMGPGPLDSTSPGDKKLAQSAQMYHYQHQKQQMLSMEKHKDDSKVPESGTTSDEENEDGDFTVYECPGLAPTGEMEVKNPLFDDSSLHPQKNHK